jgi:phosphate:Na+ symporter
MLDERLLETPSVALESARKVACRMAELSIGSLRKSLTLFENYDPKIAQQIRDEEDKVDIYEDVLGSYLVKLSARSLSERDSVDTTTLLHLIGDSERISDHSVNIVESAEEIRDKNIAFSPYANAELKMLRGAVDETLEITLDSFLNNDFDKAALVEPLEQVVDYLRDQIRIRHTVRLQKSLCSIELGFILSDTLNNLERVSDHCSNIAGCLIEMSRHETLDIHNYLHGVKENGEDYKANYDGYMQKYALPQDIYGE